MAGLQRLCKLYGSMTVEGVVWVWDYVADRAVKLEEMPEGSARHAASEKARYESLKGDSKT